MLKCHALQPLKAPKKEAKDYDDTDKEFLAKKKAEVGMGCSGGWVGFEHGVWKLCSRTTTRAWKSRGHPQVCLDRVSSKRGPHMVPAQPLVVAGLSNRCSTLLPLSPQEKALKEAKEKLAGKKK